MTTAQPHNMSTHSPLSDEHSAGETIPISETFTSIQGEGKLTGTPSFFVRASGCNLRCRWCDTPYASWSPQSRPMAIDQIVAQARRSGARHVVLTGGEPMLFDAMGPLSHKLAAMDMHITWETAGTIFRGAHEIHCDLLSISPKLRHSTPEPDHSRDPGGDWRARHEQRRLNVPVIQQLLDEHPTFQLKFVVAQPTDIDEIDTLLAQLDYWSPSDILLMPEGVSHDQLAARAWVPQLCDQRGWRSTHRLHIDLFGNQRGT